jgi:hypothetical protein
MLACLLEFYVSFFKLKAIVIIVEGNIDDNNRKKNEE